MPTVFFSWQRDTPPKEGRNFLERALERAIALVAADVELEEAERELELDRDTKGVAGQPPIVETIFRKIDAAAVFVPDLTFVGKRLDGRPMPNPNVLIEYGWALRGLGHGRIVAVMNAARGAPGDDMPFDMRHLRWPILYNLPEGADDATRRAERERLAKALAEAIRAVLGSEEYRAGLPRPPAPPPFPATAPRDGPARFRAAGEPLGLKHDSFPFGRGAVDQEIRLADGPAVWLRVMPASSPGRAWGIAELERAATAGNNELLLPLGRGYRGFDFVRAGDGFGVYAPGRDEALACSVVFAFAAGEVWTVDACTIPAVRDFQGATQRPGLPIMEGAFKAALHQYDKFLKRLGLVRPFRWIGGYGGIKGMGLLYDPAPGLRFTLPGPFGSSAVDVVEAEGLLEDGATPAQALRPLFAKLFDACGLERGDYLDDMASPG